MVWAVSRSIIIAILSNKNSNSFLIFILKHLPTEKVYVIYF